MSGPTTRPTRVLVTGAAGFVGATVVRHLVSEGHQVTALIRPASDRSRIDDLLAHIRVEEVDLFGPNQVEHLLRGQPPEVCLHLAWFISPGVHPSSLRNVDCVAGSMKLLEQLDALGCRRTVITGTCLEQDPSPGRLSEAVECIPQNFYAACKHALHVMASAFQSQHNRGFAWVRLFNSYGPGEYPGPLVPDLISKLLAGQPCDLTAGTQLRDYLHVDDVANALCRVLLSDLEGTYNLGSGHPIAVATVASLIGELIERPDLLRFGARANSPFDSPLCCAEPSRLMKDTGWTPLIPLRDGLTSTIEWWKARLRLGGRMR